LRNRRHRRSRASHAVGHATECYEYRTSRPIGLGVSLHRLLVSKGPTRSSPGTVPHPVKGRFILSRAFLHFRELAASSLPFRADTSRHLPRGFFPHRDMSEKSPLTVRFPSSHLPFRPQRFSRSRRFAPLFAVRAYFIPLPRAGFAFQGFSPLPSRCSSSLHLFSPLVVEMLSPANRQAVWRQILRPRLQGFVPSGDP
jgi:hypothetical protein